MDSESRNETSNPQRLKILSSYAKFPKGNTFLHQFVLDHSHPNKSSSGDYLNDALLSVSDVPGKIVNALNDEGYTALHLAVLKNNLLMVKELLSCLSNIDVDAKCESSRCRWLDANTALLLATELRSLPIVRELLDKGAGLDIKNASGETALCVAAKLCHVELMKLLVGEGADVNLACGFSSPLGYAAHYSRRLEAVAFLVSSGADVNFRGGWPPLCSAARSGDLALVEFLVSSGAEVNIDNAHNETPLHHAARSASLEVVAYLVSRGAEVDARDGDGQTPLHYAVRGRRKENAAYLLGRGADVDARNGRSETPLLHAASDGSSALVEILTDWDADANAADRRFDTPLHYAVSNRNSEMNRLLRISREYTRLDAVIEKNVEVAELLTDLGADSGEGETAHLRDAVYEKDLKIAAFFLDQCHRPAYVGPMWPPLHINGRDPVRAVARYQRHARVIRTLLGKGADVNAADKHGGTPLSFVRNLSFIKASHRPRVPL